MNEYLLPFALFVVAHAAILVAAGLIYSMQ
jgi:hypothetical protein